LGGVRPDDAAQPELAAVLSRQHDVGALNALEFVKDRPWARAEACAALPLLERLPQHVGEEAHEDVGLDAIGALVPHRANAELALLDPARGLSGRRACCTHRPRRSRPASIRCVKRSCISRSFSRPSTERISAKVSTPSGPTQGLASRPSRTVCQSRPSASALAHFLSSLLGVPTR
jgi:hypothetical protein